MRLRSSVVLSFLCWVLAGVAVTAQVPAPQVPAAQAAVALAVAGAPDEAPFAVTAVHDGRELKVRIKLEPGWHLYGRDTGGGQPVTVEVVDGAFAAAGALVVPMDKEGLVTGDAELRLPLRRVAAGERLRAKLRAMVCDALQCLPPVALDLATGEVAAAPTTPCRVLLVAVDESERTQRIATFLGQRGLVPTVTTYARVTAKDCDAHDVVLADSPTFGQVRGARKQVAVFPETSSPIVAVGFLGTVLLEAQKIAMACGYI